jgi:hypothetical protein
LTTTLPRAELESIVRLLDGLPGVTDATARRQFLSLALPSLEPSDRIPDDAIAAGWAEVVGRLALGPAKEAIRRLDRLLEGLLVPVDSPEALSAISAARDHLRVLEADRSFDAFLARLGLDRDPDRSGGLAFLDAAFVPPVQYDHAAALFLQEHLVFIFGDPHMGKTYCAFHLLWEDFRDRGREPVWRRAPATADASELELRSLLVPGTSVYIEDPFGRTAPLDDTEALMRSLRQLLIDAKRKDVHVVISSRTSVLQATITDGLRENVVALSQELLLDSSYDDDDLARVAGAYLEGYAPLWTSVADRDLYADAVSRVLRAPHNIQAFLSATRTLTDPVQALEQLGLFADVVQELAKAIGHFDEWVLTAMIIVAATDDANVSIERCSSIYDALESSHPPYRTFRDAVQTAREYITAIGDDRAVPRHPSVEEAIASLTRRRPSMLAATWLAIEACEGEPGLDRVAVQLLVSFVDCWAADPSRIAKLAKYFVDPNLEIRAMARRALLNRFPELPAASAGQLCDLALPSWGDRFLVQLVLHPGRLDDGRYALLAERLQESTDEQTRFFLADRIATGLRAAAAASVAQALMADSSMLVRRTAILRTIQRFGEDERIARAVRDGTESLPPRDRDWLSISLGASGTGT